MNLLRLVGVALGAIDLIVQWAAGGALLVIAITLFANSMGRFLFSASFIGGEEFARLLTVWLTFLAAYVLVRRNGHVAIDIVFRIVSDRVRRWLTVTIGVVGFVTMLYVGWIGYKLASFIFSTGQMSTTIPLRKGFFYLPVPIGGFLMAIAFLHLAVTTAIEGPERLPGQAGNAKNIIAPE